ncbi:Re/Si-specific NAD(P)(+) transhydrogenase subunit alpha [Thalassospiraceae bacterium LMO-JJ14]|nr:Re/Si-specific NAD(P)(+) transhydrogenase subunit alpha [Thalassospiraceae bacterium LMO-JJ14]
MKIAIPKERAPGEDRVAASVEVIGKLTGLGCDVVVEQGAGDGASISDETFKAAGASIAKDFAATVKDAGMVWKISAPTKTESSKLSKGQVVCAHLAALTEPEGIETLAKSGATGFAMELMPRISRAQSMDILSSQANLAGYKAVLNATELYGRAMPMMMTAAGTVPPARAFIMGVGVAGLQAIATAKRLGAAVSATDVRPATKEQVASLGGKFLEVDPEMEKEAETEGGYAKEMPPEYFEKQKQKVREHLPKQDIVVTTALIPGRPAPKLITKDMVESMKSGAVIVDMAAEAGGNCELTKPGEVTTTKNGVIIDGRLNLPSRLAETASALFAKNLFNFVSPHFDKEKGAFKFDAEDATVEGTMVCKDGKIVSERVSDVLSAKGGAKKPPARKAPAKKDETKTEDEKGA